MALLRRQHLLLKVALHIHHQRIYLFRRRQLQYEAKQCKLIKPFTRRNGWALKPRQGDPAALVVEEKWWHDNSKSAPTMVPGMTKPLPL